MNSPHRIIITGILFSLLLFLSTVGNVCAQWTKISNNVFTPNGYRPNGVLAFKDGTLYAAIGNVSVSSDTGKTWRVGLSFGVADVVTAVDCVDALHVLVLVSHKLYSSGDGGTNWGGVFFLNRNPNFYGTAACYAGSTSNIIVCSQDTIYTTLDGGVTWSKTRSWSDLREHVAFIKYRGNGKVVGLEAGTLNGIGNHLIISDDYGMTWRQSNAFPDGTPFSATRAWSFTFSPCDSSTKIFLANENSEAIPPTIPPGNGPLPPGPGYVWGTTDYGTTWQQLIQRPQFSMSGAITARGNSVFFQSVVDNGGNSQGVFRSTNQGTTWVNIGGPSVNTWDKQLIAAIGNNTVLAFDTSFNLWRTDNAGGNLETSLPPIFSDPPPISINECQLDTTQIIITGGSCQRFHLESATFSGPDVAALTLKYVGTDFPLILSDVVSDTINIFFDAKQLYGVLFDSLMVTYFDEGEGLLRTEAIPLPLQVIPLVPNIQSTITPTTFGTSTFCQTKDAIVTLKNLGCATVRLTSGPGLLTAPFSADTLPLPISFPPDSTITLHVRFHAPIQGSFTGDAVFQAEHHGLIQQIVVPLTGDAAGAYKGLSLKDSAIGNLFVSACAPKRDTAIYITNTSCDTLVITSGPGVLDSGFTADTIPLPLILAPGASIRIPVHFSTAVIGSFGAIANFTGQLSGFTQNKSVQLTGQNIGSHPNLNSDTGVNFKNVSDCVPDRDTLIRLFNRGCDTLALVSGPDNIGNGFSADPLILPILLARDSSIVVHYHFHPTSLGKYYTVVSFTATSNGYTQTMNQSLSGIGIEGKFGPEVSANSFLFDTLSICGESADTSVIFINSGCDTLKITGGPGTLSGGFTADPLSFPIIIAPNDSVPVKFHFTPPGVGTFSTQSQFSVDRGGKQSNLLLFLEGWGKSGGGVISYSPKQINFQPLPICGHDSSKMFITNVGCAAITIDPSAIFGDPDFTVVPNSIPQTILNPKDTIFFEVSINPLQKGLRQGGLAINSGAVHDSIRYTATILSGTRILSPSVQNMNFGIRSICDNQIDTTITLRNTGCDSVVVSGYTFSGSGFATGTKFPIILLPGQSITMDIFTLLDTVGGKLSSTSTLNFQSNSDNAVLPITLIQTFGSTVVRNAGLFLESAATKGTDQNTVTYNVKESPGNTFAQANINQVSFDLVYNTDLLNFDQMQSANITSSDGKTFTISGSPEIKAGANGILATIGFKVFLTKDSVTSIDLTKRVDTLAGTCGNMVITNIEGGSATFNYNFLCGDRTIQNDLNGILPLKIISLRPNPAQEEITLIVETAFSRLGSAESRPHYISIYDVTGVKVYSGERSLPSGSSEVHLDTKNLSGGVYLVRINSANGTVSQGFVKVR